MAKQYLNNQALKEQIGIYQEKCAAINVPGVHKNDLVRPQMQDELGRMFLDMATRIASKPNFKNYTTIDDMVSEAVIKCIKAAPNYDLERKTSCFSYFTQVIFMSFLQDINQLKKKAREIPVDFIEQVDKDMVMITRELPEDMSPA